MFTYMVLYYLYKVIPVFLRPLFGSAWSYFIEYKFFFKNKLKKFFYKSFYKFYVMKKSTRLFKKLNKDKKMTTSLLSFYNLLYKLVIKLFMKWTMIMFFILMSTAMMLYCELFFYKTCIFFFMKFFYPNSIYLNLMNQYWSLLTEFTEVYLEMTFFCMRYFGPMLYILFECIFTYIMEFMHQFIQDLLWSFYMVFLFFKERFYNVYCAFYVTMKFIINNLYYYSSLFFAFFKELLISIICNNWRFHLNKWFNFSVNEHFILNKMHLFFTNTFWENTIMMSVSVSHIMCIVLMLKAWECSQTFNKYQFVSGFFFIILNSWILLNSSNNLFLLTLIMLTELTSIFLLTIVLINILINKKNTKSLSIWWLLSLTFLTINTTSYTYFNYYTSVPVQTNPLVNFTYICYTTNSFMMMWFMIMLTWLILLLLNTVKTTNSYYNMFYLLSSTKTFMNKMVDNLNIFCEPFITKWNSKKKK